MCEHPGELRRDRDSITKAALVAARMNRNDYIKSLSYYYVENPFELKACEVKKIDYVEVLKFVSKYAYEIVLYDLSACVCLCVCVCVCVSGCVCVCLCVCLPDRVIELPLVPQ